MSTTPNEDTNVVPEPIFEPFPEPANHAFRLGSQRSPRTRSLPPLPRTKL